MQPPRPAGGRAEPSKKDDGSGSGPRGPTVPTTDDEIQEKYLERAIRELNQLTHRLQECSHCPRGNLMPVLGSGHPQADIMLLKYAPTAAEIEEGVAFYGRSGNALMKSFKRLGIDPLAVYGTLCVKCPVSDPALAARRVRRAGRRGDRDRPAALHRRHGRAGAGDAQRARGAAVAPARAGPGRDPEAHPDDRRALRARHRRRRSTPRSRSASFWRAFRALGDWYADLPPVR